MKAPRVFVSHATEDKAFVVELAARLRSDGIDAWLDQWEIALGDRLVDKIFTEGIGQCDAFLIVLSATSITKPWVQEELNSALVETLERTTRLLPVRIDECAVPVVLKGRKWLNLDPSQYESQYRELVGAVFGVQAKPPLGRTPTFISQQIQGYTPDESAVLRTFLQEASKNPGAHIGGIEVPGVSNDSLSNAVEMLESDGLLDVQWMIGGFMARLTPKGWVNHAKDVLSVDADMDLSRALSFVASEKTCDGKTLVARTGLTEAGAYFAMGYLEGGGYVKVLRVIGGPIDGMVQMECTATGRRAARSSSV